MTAAGYSGTPLARTMWVRDGQAGAFLALADSLAQLAEAAAFRRIELAP